MGFSGEGALSGATAGAGLGSFGGPLGIGIGAGVGLLAGGFFGGKKRRQQAGLPAGLPDISGELANISALFAQARAASEANTNRQFGEARGLAASNLAGRGIYSSPVSENTFGQLDRARLGELANNSGQLALGEAQMRSKLLEALMGLRFKGEQAQLARSDASRGALFGGLGGLGSNLLMAYLLKGQGGTPGGGGIVGGGGQDWMTQGQGTGWMSQQGPGSSFFR